jgi:hypothetical protein
MLQVERRLVGSERSVTVTVINADFERSARF